jgi:exoribonuclease R
MSQRIDQLWAQALDAAVPETYTQLSHSQVLKVKQVFAELIVQECMEVANIASADLIKEHFGVEE